jgi:hypothetical protein
MVGPVGHGTVAHNRLGIEKITERLLRDKEVYGNDLIDLLSGAGLEAPLVQWDEPGMYEAGACA